MTGFFPSSTLARSSPTDYVLPQCGACGLYKHCTTPKMEVYGEGKRGILIVGEAPGREEDERGKPFIGKSGSMLRSACDYYGIKLTRDCKRTNAIICRPAKNRTPSSHEIDYCRPNITKAIAEFNPVVIITLGAPALQSVLKPYWHDGFKTLTPWVGWQIPLQPLNCWVCPNYHPAFVLREQKKPADLFFNRYLKRALRIRKRPWKEVPDYKQQIEIVHDSDKAAKILDWMRRKGGPIAPDFEANCLKPEYSEASIYSCAICWRGKRTIAYPWHGKAIEATAKLLKSNCPKIMSNAKFEMRWARTKCNVGIKNVAHDTMLAAHQLDHRTGVAGLKFQSFVLLGLPSYDSHISPFLDAPKNRKYNRIHEIDLDDLLLYNGFDSVLEFEVAIRQRQQLGLPAL